MSYFQQQHLQQFDNALKEANSNKDYYKNLVSDKLSKLDALRRAATLEGEEKKQAVAEAVGGVAGEVGAFSGAIDRARDFNTTIRNGTLLRRNVQQTTDQIQKGFAGLKNQLVENQRIAMNPINGAREELENYATDATGRVGQAAAAMQADANAGTMARATPAFGEGGQALLSRTLGPSGATPSNAIYSRQDLQDAQDRFDNLNDNLAQENFNQRYYGQKAASLPDGDSQKGMFESLQNSSAQNVKNLSPQVESAGNQLKSISDHTDQNGFTDEARPAETNQVAPVEPTMGEPHTNTNSGIGEPAAAPEPTPAREDPDYTPPEQNPNQGNLPSRNAPTVENQVPTDATGSGLGEEAGDGIARDLSLAAATEGEVGESLSFAPELGLGVDLISGLTQLGSELYQVFNKPKQQEAQAPDPSEIKAPLGGAVGGNFSNAMSGSSIGVA